MNHTDNVLLIILTSLLSLVFLLVIMALLVVIRLFLQLKRIMDAAEEVVDSMESATEIFKDTRGKLALIKLVSNLVKISKNKKK